MAKATDNGGASTISDPVRIRVIDEPTRTVVFVKATDEVGSEQDPRTNQLPGLDRFDWRMEPFTCGSQVP